MATLDRERFAAAVRTLDRGERTAFVAALWAARGHETERVAPGVVRLGDGRRLAVERHDAEADVVVALDGRGDIGVDALCERAAYAVDRDRLAALCERFFDRPLADLTAPTRPAGDHESAATDAAADPADTTAAPAATDEDADPATAGSPERSRPRRRLAALAAVVVVLVGVGAVAFGGGAGSVGVGSAPAPPGTATVTPAPVTTPETARSARVPASRLPPGVAPDGDIDERRLAAAHTALLANRSYRLALVYREFVDGEPTGVRRETVRVAGDQYTVAVTEAGSFRTRPVSFVDRDTYANATHRLERADSGVVASTRADGDPFLDDHARLISYYLSVRSSRVAGTVSVGGRPGVWLTTDGDSWPGVTNAVGSALVDRRGLVRELVRRYDDPDREGVSVVVTLRVTAVGETSVERPGWAKNTTAVRDAGSADDAYARPRPDAA